MSDRPIINVKLDIDVVSADILPDEKTPAHAERANDTPDVKSPPSVEKILELAKDGRLSPAKPADLAKAASVEAKSQPTSLDDDDKSATESDNIETGGVSQLLALLGSPKELPVTSAEVRTTSTELISEFQALADRAGRARNDNRQASGADTQRKETLAADANAVANATASGGADRTFRFARADGKGQSVSMSINTDGDKPSARIDASGTKADAASNAKAETVTILDSRRYLGIAANTNSQAVAAAVTGSTEWARAMQPSSGLSSPEAASAASKVVNTLKIQMHPIDLGMVTATLRLKDDELHVDLKVESGEAFRQLSDDQNAMVKALRAQGFAVDQINITFNAPSDTSSGNSGSQQPQAQAGQLGRDASGDGAAQGRSRNNDSSQQRSGERWTGHGTTDEVSAASESGRTDHTYM
ncbi:flagellar hook-length control protein FliK [Rhizobium sp. 32-5/1]|uniref:flagellar hook-length control protein FliK n=1 Tax=Rhizobium sp. 32-5/1 TaxID=3019602 RepID=UPI00240D6A3E|nr:flagellar hook-length control protein FliK [Rhizobium sp. 32-5/1]WEZ84401.1 flagellar hook-length control protein FliK [Rhizobium sp. 32-5/1]